MKKILISMLLCLCLFTDMAYSEELSIDVSPKIKWLNWTIEFAVDGMYIPKLTRWSVGPSANLISVYNKIGVIGLTAQQVIGAKEDQPRSLWGPKASIDFVQAARQVETAIPESLKFSLGLAVLFDQREIGNFKPYMAYFGTAFTYLFKDVPILE